VQVPRARHLRRHHRGEARRVLSIDDPVIEDAGRVKDAADRRQGSRDTIEQGREVVAVPGPITSPVSAGCNRLIRDGATPYLEPEDLLQHYPEAAPGSGEPPTLEPGLRALPGTLTAGERDVAERLSTDALHLDALIERCARPAGELLALLCGLELSGVAEQLPGRRFRRI
jgi:DNA processing protein